MKCKKIILYFLLFLLMCGNMVMCNNADNKTVTYYEDKITLYNMKYDNNAKVYDTEYQNKLLNQINKAKENKKYTLDNPLVIKNPFNTNSLGLYIYFETDKKCYAEYTVQCDNKYVSDFTKVLNNNKKNNLSKIHEYQLIGLVPNENNTITIRLYNKNNEFFAYKKFTIGNPKVSQFADLVLQKEDGNSGKKLSDGLFVTLGYINGKDNFTYYYDNDGNMRGEIAVDGYRIDRLIFYNNLMYISVDKRKIAAINNLGYAEKVYDLGKYEMHHDYMLSKDKKKLIILVTDTSKDSMEDIVISLNLKNGEIEEIINFNNIFPEVRKNAVIPEGKVKYDWIHVNSLELLENDSILFSSRELSSIIKIKNVYNNPQVDYIMSDENIWKDTEYKKYLLKQEGDFKLHGGQHCLELNSILNDNSQYYLSLYNNNTGVSSSYPEYKWYGFDEENDESMYYKYLVNEKNRTYTLTEEIPVIKSRYISSIQHFKDNIIIESGNSNIFSEFDNSGKLIAQYNTDYKMWGLYRCFKYDFNDFYFE